MKGETRGGISILISTGGICLGCQALLFFSSSLPSFSSSPLPSLIRISLLITIFPISRALRRSLFLSSLHLLFLIIQCSHNYFPPLDLSLDTGLNGCVAHVRGESQQTHSSVVLLDLALRSQRRGHAHTHKHEQIVL